MFSEPAPNGHFVRDFLVFGGLDQGGHVSKGFLFEPPDLASAQADELNAFQDQLAVLLAALGDNQRLQVQWYCDSDYKTELLRYHKETQKAQNVWTRRNRNERFQRYWQMMQNRQLRRQKLAFFISRPIQTSTNFVASKGGQEKAYDQLLDQIEREFRQIHETLSAIFGGQGGRITPMTATDNYRHIRTFLNPSLIHRHDTDSKEGFEPQLSIQENCWHSEAVGQSDTGFWMDGYYHGLIVLKRWPSMTFPGIIHRLTDLSLLDYNITVNIDPIPVRGEIAKEEKEHDRIAGDYASEKKVSLLSVMQKKQKKIAALMEGHTLPFNALLVIRVWDKSKEGLAAKAAAIKNAVNSMNSAQYFESSLPATTKKLFYQTWPGWLWGKYECRKLYAEHAYLADMLPISATFTGHLTTAEAIYDGNAGNLVGIKTFAGSKGNESPQHAVMLGMSGAGKSVNVTDLLTQTELYYDYTVLIEEGLSYGIYTQTVSPESQPIILQPDGTLTINYLATGGLPLTPLHLSSAAALVSRMAGASKDEDRQMLRQAQISRYLNQLYEDSYQEWTKNHPDQIHSVARHAVAISRFRREHMPAGSNSIEAFVDHRDWAHAHPDEAHAFLNEPDEGEILRFLKNSSSAREVRNLAFSYFQPQEYPEHRMLQELMQLEASGAERNQIIQIATLLRPWCRDGQYGALFDGQSNISLTGKIAHFELGYIPESSPELKSAAAFLITNHTRQHIITLPRGAKKRNNYEEVARLAQIPGGRKIIEESYAQMRKFNCWNISILQQASQLESSGIRKSIIGNSRQFFLMRQSDRTDVEDLSRDIALPEITKQAILNYPLPDQQSGQKYSAFTYFHTDAQRPICGTVQNVTSPEMLYCSSTSGQLFERRAKALKNYENIVQGIIHEANPPTEK
ncbi:MAG: TraC family protein [Verrucomicrobiales bacterium]